MAPYEARPQSLSSPSQAPHQTPPRLPTTLNKHANPATSNRLSRPRASPTMSDAPAASSTALRMSYRIGRGEQGVLTFEPYKSALLPLWRFRTAAIARKSAADLWAEFERYGAAEDFVGMDMARKFIQMGMTRAKRYANHKGGRKYEKGSGRELEKSKGHAGMEEKEQASLVFREVWERCRAHEGYARLKAEFQAEQKEWDRARKRVAST